MTDGRSDGQTVGRSDGQTESIMAKTALCIASYADALSKNVGKIKNVKNAFFYFKIKNVKNVFLHL